MSWMAMHCGSSWSDVLRGVFDFHEIQIGSAVLAIVVSSVLLLKLRTGILVHFWHSSLSWIHNWVLRTKKRQFLLISGGFAFNDARIQDFRLGFENLLVSSILTDLVTRLHMMRCHLNYGLPVVPLHFTVVGAASHLPNALPIGLNGAGVHRATPDLIWILAVVHSFWSYQPHRLLCGCCLSMLEHFLIVSSLIGTSDLVIMLVR